MSRLRHAPAEAVAAGAVGAMLQTGALIRDLSVRELVAMMASLYPAPLAVDEVLALTGIGDDRRAADAEALRRPGPARALRGRARQQPASCSCSTSRPSAMDVEGRHAFWRRCASSPRVGKTVVFATHYLEEADAYADRAVLMAHGGRRRRRPDDRDQGEGRARARSARRCRAPIWPSCAALPGVTGAERRGEAVMLTAPTPTPAIRALLAAHPARATSRSAAPASRRRSCELTGDDDEDAVDERAA